MNKVCIITGGSRGIGKGIAKLFLEKGYKVAIVSKNSESLAKAKFYFDSISLEPVFFECDISDPKTVKETVSAIHSSFGRIDTLINSAGISKLTLLEEDCFEEWKKQIDINLSGTFYFSKEVFMKMKEKNSGSIINISSVYGLIGGEGYSAYCASKHGVIGLTKSMALEASKYNITVNSICPGWVETDMFDNDMTELSDKYGIEKDDLISDELNAIPLKKFSSVDDVAELAYWLSSDKARNMTGQALNLSGGLVV